MFDICSEALKLGFSCVGVAKAAPLNNIYAPIFEQRMASDFDQNIAYMSRNLEKRLDPCRLFEGARSVIVCGLSSSNLPFATENSGRIATYGLCRDYHLIIKELLAQLSLKLKEAYPEARGRTFVDTAPLLEKAWAVEAGLGYIGRNSLLINPDFGTRLFLGEIVTNIELPSSSTNNPIPSCNNCTACIDNCPTGAILHGGGFDSRRCIARRTTEKEDPSLSRDDLHGWLFGCEICQHVCPENIGVKLPPVSIFEQKRDAPTLEEWTHMSEKEFDVSFGDSPMSRAGVRRIAFAAGKDRP